MSRKSELMRVSPEFKQFVRSLKIGDQSDASITKQITKILGKKRKRVIEI